MQTVAINTLSLAFCPLSNQEGDWLKNDPEVLALHRDSKLYMIAQRHEVLFRSCRFEEELDYIIFDLVCDTKTLTGIKLPVEQFRVKCDGQILLVEVSDKMLRFRKKEPGKTVEECDVVHWLTPDRLFMFYSHDRLEVEGLEGYRMFTELELHYVGLSTKQDSFTRLFAKAHQNRCNILSNEGQLNPTSRLTDELIILMFNVEAMQIVSDDELFGTTAPLPPNALAADAEKAFIKVLDSEYNVQKYENYPKSSDGLFGSGLTRYGFVINECYSLKTETETIRGARLYNWDPADQPDLILVEDDAVSLVKLT